MLSFFIGLIVGFLPMWFIARNSHNWYMKQIDGLSRYVAVVQQELWDARYERILGKDYKAPASIDTH